MNQFHDQVRNGALTVLPPGGELDVRYGYPNLFERIIRTALHLTAIAALLLACVLMLGAIDAVRQIGDGLDRLRSPQPAATGCPFGDGECGG